MREIVFRGKRIDNGKWVEGDLLRTKFYLDDSEHSLIFTATVEFPRSEFGGANEVIPETVGQFTGLTDKNGKRIFEGDILSFPDTGEDGYEYKEGYDFTNVAVVCWNYGRWELKDYGDYNSGVKDDMDGSCHFDFITTFLIGEVIGNIHDNLGLIVEAEGC